MPDALSVSAIHATHRGLRSERMFVCRFLNRTNSLGQRLIIGREMGEKFTDEPREIVRVVEDTHGKTLSEAAAYFDSNQVLFRVSTD
ncbi:MAG: hypothetical protein LC794_03085 [Acidobacteria bacterium]|nr:hypothetical protein [Acidobacteriota bacterium]